MDKNYCCEFCKKEYKSYIGLWKHNKKYHWDVKKNNVNLSNICKYCNKQLSSRQGRWRHEQKCKLIEKSFDKKIQELSEKIKALESKTTNNTVGNFNTNTNTNTNTNNTNNNNSNNTTNNIQYIINAPEASTMNHLTFELQKEVLDKGLNSLVCLIELINFNKSVPENHSYCITAINDKHASVIDDKTNKIIKTNKFDLFDKLLGANLDNLEKISDNHKFTQKQKQEYKDKINYLKTMMFQNNKFIKRYQNDINLISYNNKNMIKETWKSLKELEESSDKEEYQIKGFDDLVDELPEEEKPDFIKNRKPTIELDSDTSEESSDKEEYKVKGFDDLVDELPEKEKPDFVKKNRKPIIELNSDTSEESEGENEFVEIKIKGIMYILDGQNIYSKTKRNTKGKLYGTLSNGKIKKVLQSN